MSVQATTWTWNNSKAQGIDRLVLLALADHAHPDGTHAYPSVATIAAMTMVSERTVQRALQHLVDMGEIEVVTHARHHAPTEYRLKMWGDSVTPLPGSGVTNDLSGVTRRAVRGDTATSPKPNNPYEPTPTPIPKRLDRRAVADARRRRTASEDVAGLLGETRATLRATVPPSAGP